ncbi:MAG: hypothetical protein GKR87_02590 [Kiritimatiellae bacterium]|nr:hypothetical protein [Kiritimatiellia bacterium]
MIGTLGLFFLAGSVAFFCAAKFSVIAFSEGWSSDFAKRTFLMASIPDAVGLLISGQLFLQASWILASESGRIAWILAGILTTLWLINRKLSRTFYTS